MHRVEKLVVRTLLIAAVVLVDGGLVSGQNQAQTSTVLDLVLRDKDGNLIRDLKPQEIEVTDQGVAQELESLQFEPQSVGPRHITMVFGGLTNDGRQFARQAASDFLRERPGDDVLISVFVIDRTLYALQPFTDDEGDLGKSIELATSGSFEKFIETSNKIRRDLAGKRNLSDAERVIVEALNQAGKTQKEEWTYAALDSLNILTEELGRLPGRKPVILFSEGLVIRDVMFSRFNFLISAANLAHAPIYTVDARGLLTSGVTQGSRDMLSGASDASQSQFGAGTATSSGQVRALESASQSVRMNVQESLENLSGQTGGFLIANTNDSLPGMKRIVEELDGYYRLKYRAHRQGDGTFRTVSVQVTRPAVTIQSASGYFDIPDAGGERVFSYELPMLSLLSKAEVSNPFALHAKMLRFGAKGDTVQHTFALAVPLRHFSFATTEETKTYSTHFSLMGVLKDSQGEVIEKFSQDYPLQGPLDKMEGLRSGSMLFLRNFSVSPGDYTLEVAGVDQATAQTSGMRIPVRIEAPSDGPAVSDLVIIDRVDPISDQARERDNPLRYQDRKIAPNMGAPLIKGPNAQLGLYCVVYPSSDIKDQPKLGVLFFRNGQPLFKGEPALPQPDEDGKMQVVLNLPLTSFQPGNYEIVAVVQQGETAVERKTSFSVAE
ncbi:MAG: VWA domain-containing protein [Acidobacteriota bacterium]